MFLTNSEDFKKFARGLVYVFIAIFPFLLYQGFIYNGTSTRAFNLILLVEILGIVLGFILFSDEKKITVPKSPVTIALFVLLLSLVLSSIMGASFATSFWSNVTRMSGLYYFLHLGIFYLFIFMLFNDREKIRKLIKIFLVSSGIFSIGALFKDGFGLIFKNREWQGFTIGNSTFAGMYLYTAFMLSIYYIYSIEKSNRKWWHFLVPIIFILNPYFLNQDFWNGASKGVLGIIGGAQASTYALIFSVVALIAVWGISKIKEAKIRRGFIWAGVVSGLVIGFVAVHSFLSPGGLLQEKYLSSASNARPMVWSLSEKAISEKPAFGWGVDNFPRAYEAHYDNRVMEKINGGEAWFDRAHNIFIDQTLETGYVGVVVYILVFLTIIASLIYVLLRSAIKEDQAFAVVLVVYFIGHLMELQTAFDTTISYVPLIIMAVLSAYLFHKTYSVKARENSAWTVPTSLQYVTGVVLIGGLVTMFFIGTVPIMRAQVANGHVRTVGSSEKRLPIYPVLFGSPVDTGGFLNRTFSDIKRGVSLDSKIIDNPKKVEGFKKEFELMVASYEEYLSNHPDDYRVRLSLTDLYIYQRLYGVDNLEKAEESADKAISLVPNAPQAYWQKSVAYLYQRKFNLAREWAKKAYDLNPNIEESQRLVKYIEDSIKTFPEINLYNFIML